MAWIGLSGPDFEYFSIDIFNELYKSGNSKRSYSSFSEVTQEVFSTQSKMAALCKNITGHSTYRIYLYIWFYNVISRSENISSMRFLYLMNGRKYGWCQRWRKESWLRFSTTQLSTDNFLAHDHTPTTYTDMTYLLRIKNIIMN